LKISFGRYEHILFEA
jgi:hypothetical protein